MSKNPKKPTEKAKTFARLTIDHSEYYIEFDTALKVIALLKDARNCDHSYANNVTRLKRKVRLDLSTDIQTVVEAEKQGM